MTCPNPNSQHLLPSGTDWNPDGTVLDQYLLNQPGLSFAVCYFEDKHMLVVIRDEGKNIKKNTKIERKETGQPEAGFQHTWLHRDLEENGKWNSAICRQCGYGGSVSVYCYLPVIHNFMQDLMVIHVSVLYMDCYWWHFFFFKKASVTNLTSGLVPSQLYFFLLTSYSNYHCGIHYRVKGLDSYLSSLCLPFTLLLAFFLHLTNHIFSTLLVHFLVTN